MHRHNAGFHPVRTIFSSVSVVLLSVLYTAGAGGFVLELVGWATSTLGLAWSPAALSATSRITLSIFWFALMVPVFMGVVFRSFLVSVIWQFLRHGNWLESTRVANKKLSARYEVRKA